MQLLWVNGFQCRVEVRDPVLGQEAEQVESDQVVFQGGCRQVAESKERKRKTCRQHGRSTNIVPLLSNHRLYSSLRVVIVVGLELSHVTLE